MTVSCNIDRLPYLLDCYQYYCIKEQENYSSFPTKYHKVEVSLYPFHWHPFPLHSHTQAQKQQKIIPSFILEKNLCTEEAETSSSRKSTLTSCYIIQLEDSSVKEIILTGRVTDIVYLPQIFPVLVIFMEELTRIPKVAVVRNSLVHRRVRE